MQWLKKVDDLVGYVSGTGAAISGAFNFVILILVCAEVINRNIFNASFLGATELTGYCMTGVVFYGLAYSMRHDVFVRVDFLYRRFKGRVKAVIDTVLIALAFFYTGKMASFVYPLIITALERGTDSGTALHFPMWIHRFMIVSGLCVLMLQLAVLLIAAAVSIWKPEDETVLYVLGNHDNPMDSVVKKKRSE